MTDEIGGEELDTKTDEEILDEVSEDSKGDSEDSSESGSSDRDSGDGEESEDGDERSSDSKEEVKEEKEEEELPGDSFDKLVTSLKESDPEIFKKNPELRPILGEHRQFREVFASPEEAKEAVEQNQRFNELGEAILGGNSGKLLKELYDTDENSYTKFVEEFLPTIEKADNETFVRIIDPVFRRLLKGISANGGEQDKLAVKYIAKYLWGSKTGDIPQDKQQDNEKVRELEAQRAKDQQNHLISNIQRFEGEVADSIETSLNTKIIKEIDPEGAYPAKIQKAMIKDVIVELNQILAKDSKHNTLMRSLRSKAQKDDFSRDARVEIVSAVLARVRTLLPSVSAKVSKDYITDKRVREQINTEGKHNKKFIPSSGSQGKNGPRKLDSKNFDKSIFKTKSDEEILDMD